jgi:hypothetical protein
MWVKERQMKKMKLALKFTRGTVKLSIAGKELDEVEYFILESLWKGRSFGEISEAINIDRGKLVGFFSYLEGKFIENSSLTPYGKEVFLLNRFVRNYNSAERRIYIDKYVESKKGLFLVEKEGLPPGISQRVPKGYQEVKENIYHYKAKLHFEKWINGNNKEKLRLIRETFPQMEEEKDLLEKNIAFINVSLSLSKEDYFLCREFEIEEFIESLPSRDEDVLFYAGIPYLDVKVSSGEKKISWILSPYFEELPALDVKLRKSKKVSTVSLPFPSCENSGFSCQISEEKFVSISKKEFQIPFGRKLLEKVMEEKK